MAGNNPFTAQPLYMPIVPNQKVLAFFTVIALRTTGMTGKVRSFQLTPKLFFVGFFIESNRYIHPHEETLPSPV